uniref:Retrotransposon protein, putative, Ty3-gypsy subclass n=1 Tax=Oryza sativa subsp. japonica TaxID=39947 RepID=Q2QRR1_ORYSJ|nr:retrotransposon protein, putative, Ty3-gypsy subclass [Oryza sativa Japonica Group]
MLALAPPPPLSCQLRRAAASVAVVAVRRHRRVREEDYPVCPFAAAEDVDPSQAAICPRHRSSFVIVRRSSLHRCPRIARLSPLSLFSMFRRRAFTLRRVLKYLKKHKAGCEHMVLMVVLMTIKDRFTSYCCEMFTVPTTSQRGQQLYLLYSMIHYGVPD